MNASLVKYCPICGFENQIIASFCVECDSDLMHAPAEARREEISQALEMRDAVASGREEPLGVASSSLEEVATLRAASVWNALVLELVFNPALKFEVLPGQSVGRASKADIVLHGVHDLEYISRAHARFIQRQGQWYVQYIAEGNSITVDGVESRDDSEIAIYDGSLVVLSFTAFRVTIR
jgi:hypothetical protein